jgi:hypothetical protein
MIPVERVHRALVEHVRRGLRAGRDARQLRVDDAPGDQFHVAVFTTSVRGVTTMWLPSSSNCDSIADTAAPARSRTEREVVWLPRPDE